MGVARRGQGRTNKRYSKARWLFLVCLVLVSALVSSPATADRSAGGVGKGVSAGSGGSSGSSGGSDKNRAPVARGDSYTTGEDRKLTVKPSGVLRNDADADGDKLSAIKPSRPQHGKLDLNRNGSFVYTPAKNYNGNDSFSYRAADGKGGTDRATVKIVVKAVNDRPVARGDAYKVKEDNTLNVSAAGVLKNDTDADRDRLSAIKPSGPGHGKLKLNRNGSFVYTPDQNYNGKDSFSYRAADGKGGTDRTTVKITVGSVSDAPSAADDSYSTDEGTTLNVSAPGVLDNDTDADGGSLKAIVDSNPTNGSLTLNENGSFEYTPNNNFTGDDSFTYKANDGTSDSNTATVSISVRHINRAPVNTVPGDQSIDEDTSLTFSGTKLISVSDADAADNPVKVTLEVDKNGKLTLSGTSGLTFTDGDGTADKKMTFTGKIADINTALDGLVYDPEGNFNGDETLTITTDDQGHTGSGGAKTDTDTVDITVEPVADAPEAQDDTYSTDEDTPLSVAAPGVLDNDTDADGGSLTAVLVSGPAHGIVTFNVNGSFTYTPRANYNGSDSFSYKASDGTFDSNTATVSITVDSINDAPRAADDSYSTGEDTTLNVSAPGVLDNDTDDEGDSLKAIVDSNPTNGSLTLNENGSFEYTPNNNFTGDDSFTYKANDGTSDSNTATVSISVRHINRAPVNTVPGDQSIDEDTSLTFSGAKLISVSDADAADNPVKVTLEVDKNGKLTLSGTSGLTFTDGDGTADKKMTFTGKIADINTALDGLVYDPEGNFNGDETLTITTDDQGHTGSGGAKTDTDTVDITVEPVNDAPVVTRSSGSLAYTENDPATAVDPNLTVVDDNQNLTRATVQITGNYASGEDVLGFTDQAAITGSYNASTGKLTLSGPATVSGYQAALRSVTYENTSENPSSATRTVTFTATDADSATSAPVTRDISITAVDDPPVAVNDSVTVLEDAAATAIPVLANDTDADGGPKAISSATDPANGTVVLTGGSPGAHTGLTYQPDPNYCNDPPATDLDTFTYTLNGGSQGNVSMKVTCVDDAPVADDEDFNGNSGAIGNTTLVVDDPDDGAPNPAHPGKTITGDILDGDTDVDGPGPLTVTPGTFATNDGGSVTIESDGDFTFDPAASTSCTDTSDFFDYTVEDSATPKQTDTGRVTISIAGCVWYVSNNAAGDSGTSSAPFGTLGQAEAASGANHTVFVFDGDNTSTGYGGDGYAMNAGERLIGEHEGLVVDPDGSGTLDSQTLHPANDGAHPTLTATGFDVIDLDDGNEVRGINIDPQGTGGGIAGGSGDTGGGTLDDVNIVDNGTAGTQPGLELDSTSGTFNVSNLVVNNKATGVRLNNAGTVSFASNGTLSITSSGARGLDAAGTNMGTSTFDNITVTGSDTGGVSMSATSGTTTFGDGAGTDLSLTTASGSTPAFRLSNAGAVTVPSGGTANVSATGGPAIDVTGTSGASLAFDDVDSTNSADDGINIDGLGNGTFSANSNSTITGATGIAFDLDGGSGTVDFDGAISNGQGSTAEITNRAGGTVRLDGPITESGDSDTVAGEAGGIVLTSNTGGSTVVSGSTKSFSTGEDNAIVMGTSDGHALTISGGSLDIDTSTGKGLEATSSGTLNVTGSGNTIDTGSGKALNVTNTDVGSGNPLTFQRISSNGANGGIQLSNTGPNSALTVTSSGSGTCTSADTSGCSGGTIANTTGADDSGATPAGTGIVLNNTSGVSLTRMRVHNHSNYGIRGTDVNGFTLANSVINGTNGTNESGPYNDGSVNFRNLTGSASIGDTSISGGRLENLRVLNSSGTLNRLTVNNVTFGHNSNLGGQSLLVEPTSGAVINATVTNSRFTGARDQNFQFNHNGTAAADLVFTGNALSNNHSNSLGGGAVIAHGGSAAGQTLTYNVSNNTSQGAKTSALTISKPGGTGTMSGTVSGNTIGVQGTANSGSEAGSGIRIIQAGQGTFTTSITNNRVYQYNGTEGIYLQAGGVAQSGGPQNNGTLNATVTGNTISNPGTLGQLAIYGIHLNSGTNSNSPGGTPDAYQVCTGISGNTITGSGAQGGENFILRQRFATTVRLPGYTGAAFSNDQVAAFVSANNGGATGSASSTPSGGGGGFQNTAGGAACPQP